MAKGIEQRIAQLERDVNRLANSVARVRGVVFGKDVAAPKQRKPRKPRAPRQALGSDPLDPHGVGALPATDPRYGGAPKKRGRKKAGVEAESAGGEG